MTLPGTDTLFDVIEATWPPARAYARDGWVFRDGQGGGQRVSAATAQAAEPSVAALEREQTALGQPWLAMIRPGDAALDAVLDAAGYAQRDPTAVLLARAADLAGDGRPVAVYPSWPPLAIQAEIWAEGGLDPARLDVMHRAEGQKTTFLGRVGDRPVATAYIACAEGVAMLHALEVAPDARREGVGRAVMREAAAWAMNVGAEWLSVLVVRSNAPALGLYRALGMDEVGGYHYRRLSGQGR